MINTFNVFGIFTTDDRGYSRKDEDQCLGWYPFRAAAEEARPDNYYNVDQYEAIRIFDEVWIVENRWDKSYFAKFKFKDGEPKEILYVSRGNDVMVGEINDIDKFVERKPTTIKKITILSFGSEFWTIPFDKPIKLETVKMSRELAIKHALSKLTDEEKKLLGL